MKLITICIAAVIASILTLQLIPYGHFHENPPVIKEPHWNSAKTHNLVKQACFDCHSNESIWPWYSRIAPVSWLITYDVKAGRNELNFSDWQDGKRKAELISKMGDEIREGGMPPFQYRLAHPSARLSDAEKQQLIDGLRETEQQGFH